MTSHKRKNQKNNAEDSSENEDVSSVGRGLLIYWFCVISQNNVLCTLRTFVFQADAVLAIQVETTRSGRVRRIPARLTDFKNTRPSVKKRQKVVKTEVADAISEICAAVAAEVVVEEAAVVATTETVDEVRTEEGVEEQPSGIMPNVEV